MSFKNFICIIMSFKSKRHNITRVISWCTCARKPTIWTGCWWSRLEMARKVACITLLVHLCDSLWHRCAGVSEIGTYSLLTRPELVNFYQQICRVHPHGLNDHARPSIPPTWRTNVIFIVWDSYSIFPFRFYPPLQVFRSSTYMVRGVWSSDMSVQYGSNILLPPNCSEIPTTSLPLWHSTPLRYLSLTRMWHWTKDVKSTYHLIPPFCCKFGLTVRLPGAVILRLVVVLLQARVPGLCQITWRIVMTKKMRSHLAKKLHKNREIAVEWEVGLWVNRDIWLRAQISASPETKHKRSAIAFAVTSVAPFSLQVPKSCTNPDPTVLYMSTFGTNRKFVRENKMLSLGVCLPQAMPERRPQVCRVKITFKLLENFVSFP